MTKSDLAGGLFVPGEVTSFDQQQAMAWLDNIGTEIVIAGLTPVEAGYIGTNYTGVGVPSPWRRAFFDHHYAGPLSRATQALFSCTERPRILDLGCGIGSQSILFALLGAEVVGADMDSIAIEIFHKRLTFWQQKVDRTLPITIIEGNIFETDLSDYAPFDGIYSLFAFNLMQPTADLLKHLSGYLSDTAVFAVQDGNRKHWIKRLIWPRDVLSRDELRSALAGIGFTSVDQRGCASLPPVLWSLLPGAILDPLDRILASSDLLTSSYLHLGYKT